MRGRKSTTKKTIIDLGEHNGLRKAMRNRGSKEKRRSEGTKQRPTYDTAVISAFQFSAKHASVHRYRSVKYSSSLITSAYDEHDTGSHGCNK